MRSSDDAVTEVTDEILILILVMILAAAVFVMLIGMIQITPKTPYLSMNFSYEKSGGNSVILVRHIGGDEIQFAESAQATYPVTVYVDTTAQSYRAAPGSTTGSFRAGDNLYLFYNGTGFSMTTNSSGITAHALPSSDLRISFVDTRSNILIQGWGSLPYGTTAAVTATPTTTANVTPTATTTATPTATANITATATTTTTATPSTYAISVSWVPKGTGGNAQGSVSPPGTNDATVTVTTGASQTFTATPAAGYRVRFIFLDGTQVSSGGVTNQVITYTLSNVQASHTFTVHFGS